MKKISSRKLKDRITKKKERRALKKQLKNIDIDVLKEEEENEEEDNVYLT